MTDSVKINRFKIRDNGRTAKRIYDYLIGEDVAYLQTNDKEVNCKLGEAVLKVLNEEYKE